MLNFGKRLQDKSLCSGKNHKFTISKELSAFATPSLLLLKDFPGEVLSTVKISEDFNQGN